MSQVKTSQTCHVYMSICSALTCKSLSARAMTHIICNTAHHNGRARQKTHKNRRQHKNRRTTGGQGPPPRTTQEPPKRHPEPPKRRPRAAPPPSSATSCHTLPPPTSVTRSLGTNVLSTSSQISETNRTVFKTHPPDWPR